MDIYPDFWSDSTQKTTVDRGLFNYNNTLKNVLEPDFVGQVVAIHVDTGDYAVGRNSSLASRALHAKHSEGLTVSLDIGAVPVEDPQSIRMRGEASAGGKP